MIAAYFTADKITVDDDDGRYVLKITTDDGDVITVDIHSDVLAFYAAVQREIRPYVLEAENARQAVASGVSRARFLGATGHDDDGYDLDDPKHPTFHERMVD